MIIWRLPEAGGSLAKGIIRDNYMFVVFSSRRSWWYFSKSCVISLLEGKIFLESTGNRNDGPRIDLHAYSIDAIKIKFVRQLKLLLCLPFLFFYYRKRYTRARNHIYSWPPNFFVNHTCNYRTHTHTQRVASAKILKFWQSAPPKIIHHKQRTLTHEKVATINTDVLFQLSSSPSWEHSPCKK